MLVLVTDIDYTWKTIPISLVAQTRKTNVCHACGRQTQQVVHGCGKIHKKYHPPANKPNPTFASPTVFRETAAPVDATILCVALADPVVADPELREAVPEAAEEAEAIDKRSVCCSD
jgi:hypothetical protein